MVGYLNAPSETAAVLLAENVLRTGDVGRVDNDGYVYVDGRVKTLIDVSGKKVSPEEIETILLQIPGVAEARVVGEPDPLRGELPVAYVVPAAGTQIRQSEIGGILRGQLARYKWPKRIVVVDHLARTFNGKVRRW
jgi:long-chain acyl-CoA synthetase